MSAVTMRFLLPSVLFLSFLSPVTAQQSDYIEDFKLNNLVSGSEFSLKDYAATPTVVVIFTSLHCPYAKLYNQRITKLIADFESDKVRFLLINPTNPAIHPQDTPANLKQVIAENQWKVPFLTDPSQKVARLLGAEKTPEVFVLSQQQGLYKTIYQGAIDDNPQVANDVRHPYLREFLSAQRKQSAQVRTTPAAGCRIKP